MDCYRGHRCAGWDADVNQPAASRVPFKYVDDADEWPFCHKCQIQINYVLEMLPHIRLNLEMAIGDKSGRGDGGGSRSVFPPLPIRLDVDGMRREIDLSVRTWSEHVCSVIGMRDDILRFADRVAVISTWQDVLYATNKMPVVRWVPAHRVVKLPDHVTGVVTKSGDAIVTFDMSGADAAVELLTLFVRACRILRIEPELPAR